MKQVLFFGLFWVFHSMLCAQVTLSPYSKILEKETLLYLQAITNKKEIALPQEFCSKYLIKKKKDGYYVGAILEAQTPALALASLKEKEIKVRTQIGNIWTVDIPITVFPQLRELKGVKYIQMDHKIETRLKEARADSRVEAVHRGLNLPSSYKGKGVIIGMIDGGIDFTHPTFRDAQNLSKLRIQRAWVQGQEGGTPPQGYDYGSEFIGEKQLLAQKSDGVSTHSHGTHVTGIAAGIGDDTTDDFKGYAPEADIIQVSINNLGSNIIDAMNYIFSHAQKKGKPAVINMSLGTHIGPHDGSSLLDRAFKQIVGPGKILVGAAGNEAIFPMHLSHNFSGDTIYTVAHSSFAPQFQGFIRLEMWGPENEDFCANIILLDKNGQMVARMQNWYKANDNAEHDTTIQIDFQSSLRIMKQSTSAAENFNKKANMQIAVEVSGVVEDLFIGLAITARQGIVHLWNDGMGVGAPLLDSIPGGAKLVNFRRGDNESTTGEIGGTGEALITVGAYTTKNRYWDIDNTERTILFYGPVGEIAEFSSRGPTVDGRIKPEITAPGNVVVSALSSFDTTIVAAMVLANINFENQNYVYGVYHGTSMATPCVAGAVALMLEANPNLNAEQTKQILMSAATKDNFTGPLTQPNNTWGAGKLNVYESVRLAHSLTSFQNSFYAQELRVLLFPNPARANATLDYSVIELSDLNVTIADNLGKIIYQTTFTPQSLKGNYTLPLENLAQGFYTVAVRQNNYQNIIKMAVE